MNKTIKEIIYTACHNSPDTDRRYLFIFPPDTTSLDRYQYNEAIDYLRDTGCVVIKARAIGMVDFTITERGLNYLRDL